MPTEITPELLKPYFTGNKRHPLYKKTVQMYEDLRVHADGEMPKHLITERRPSESKEIRDYREKIFISKTKGTVNKVINSLSKIRRSEDWSIKYNGKRPAVITEDESLQEYCEKKFPHWTSVTNWTFNVLLKNYLLDANGVIAVIPLSLENIPDNEYTRPYPYVFNSQQVYEFKEDEYAILLSTEKYIYKSGKTDQEGDVFFVITTKEVIKYVQVNSKRDFEINQIFTHNMGELPVFKIRGQFYKSLDNQAIFESRINSMLPELQEATREYSDLQAEVVQHVHSQKWEYDAQGCSTCKGVGMLSSKEGMIQCHVCEGKGTSTSSSFSKLVVKAPEMGQTAVPTPPAGYITKSDVAAMVKIMDERINQHLISALSAVNMQFLDKTPLAESGTAKEVDREELNNFVHSIAEDIVFLMDLVYFFINEYRYSFVVPEEKTREAMLPVINVPAKYDMLSAAYLMDEIAKARTAKASPVIIQALEGEYTAKKFITEPYIRDEIMLINELDPFGALTSDDKALFGQNDWANERDLIVSVNIQQFIRRAMSNDPGFIKKPYEQKREILNGFADEMIAEGSAAGQILSAVGAMGEGGNPLAQSVGGLTGMIEIVKAVASGVYDLEAAVALVSQRFGITEEEARKQIGTPTIVQSEEVANKINTLT